ncbi:MarR family winged helix-turn-helix transcriptional regulator [Paenibacillus rhizoplanae]
MDNNHLFQKFIAFTAAVHQITNDISRDVNSDGLTPLQYKIVEYIAVSQPVTLSEISDCMNMSMPNTSRELRKLSEKKGYVPASPIPLTAAGRELRSPPQARR